MLYKENKSEEYKKLVMSKEIMIDLDIKGGKYNTLRVVL